MFSNTQSTEEAHELIVLCRFHQENESGGSLKDNKNLAIHDMEPDKTAS